MNKSMASIHFVSTMVEELKLQELSRKDKILSDQKTASDLDTKIFIENCIHIDELLIQHNKNLALIEHARKLKIKVYEKSIKELSLNVAFKIINSSQTNEIEKITFLKAISKVEDENFHSDYIASLLNSQLMGEFSFKFLEEILKVSGLNSWAINNEKKLDVSREKRLDQIDFDLKLTDTGARRIDLLIRHNNFVLIIENKINSSESENQTKDYYQVVSSIYEQEDKLDRNHINTLGILLSPNLIEPQESKFKCITYKELIACLDKASKYIQGDFETQFFNLYYSSLIQTYIVQDIKYNKEIIKFWSAK